ncbi:MAG: ribose 5-phosphate isomerase B [Armatimonadota bacterium]|nr:ribose 5-phosphate isomerase B [bacterium]
MRIAIGADHAGYELKEHIREFLEEEGHEVTDVGALTYDRGDDYPIYAADVARQVSSGQAERGILVCDSGIGVDIVANKFAGVRSALVHDEELARLTRQHNDSNILSLGAMFMDENKAERIVEKWLETEFSGVERHERRVNEITQLESERCWK